MEAHLLTLNEFNLPMVLTEHNANYTHLVYIILLEKGKFQSHPDMGVGIRSRYRYNNDDNMLYDLREDIKNQVEKYLPEISNIEEVVVGLLGDTKGLGIVINTTDGAYSLSYNPVDDKLTTGDQEVINILYGGNEDGESIIKRLS